MRAAALSLVLASTPAWASPPVVAPVPIAPAAPAEVAPAPVAAPSPVLAPAAATPGAAAAAPVTTAAAPAASSRAGPAPAEAARSAVPLQAVIDKLGKGDRAFLAGDYRTALFAYQDAVYMAPRNATARVKLGRAYLALRYPAQAIAQAEQALASAPDDEGARRLLQDANSPPAKAPAAASASPSSAPAAAPSAAPVPSAAAAPAVAVTTPAAVAPQQAHVYRFPLEPETSAPATEPDPRAAPPAREAAVASGLAPEVVPTAAATQREPASVSQGAPAPAAASRDAVGPPAATPAQHYRAALELLSNREFQSAIGELSAAIAADPRLAVAWAARGSAQFGLGRYREAAEDYRSALALDANLATPLYGLAECYRVLGDSRSAADMYQRYADSRASDVRDDLRTIASKRAQELR